MVSRKLLRWLVRLTILLCFASFTVFVTDVWYDFLPSSIQTRLPYHPKDPVLIDLKVKSCGILPSCDAKEGDWTRYPKELLLGESWTSKAYIYTKSINENELPSGQEVILSVAVGKFNLKDLDAALPDVVYNDLRRVAESEQVLHDRHMAFELATKEGWKIVDEKHSLWLKRGKHVPNGVVTSVKVLFGEDAQYPLEHWTLTDTFDVESSGPKPRIAFRTGRGEPVVRPQLKFNREGKLKIIQLADLHMSTGDGMCQNPVPQLANEALCKADMRTMDFIEAVVEQERPDYAVYTGDQIMGNLSPDPETALLKAFAPVIKKKIPFSVVWGNHDNQGPLDNAGLMDIVKELPYALVDSGPEDVPGIGNYLVTASPANSDYPALSVVFLDSHGKLPHKGGGYDFIKPEQQEFVRGELNSIRSRLHGYSHMPLSMAFLHIPLPEYRDGSVENSGIVRVGSQRENVIGPAHNSGTLEALRELGVSVISVGHDHVNDFCQLQPPKDDGSSKESVWLCYGGGGGFGGYGGYPDSNGDFKRRIRVFDLDLNLPYIDTWHRVQYLSVIQNRVRLVDSGVARYGAGESSEAEQPAESQ